MGIQSRNKVSVTFSMSSLTDIVFLLLIFFIILSTLINPYGEKVDLPNSDNRTTEKPSVSVTIKKDLTYYLGARKIAPEKIESALINAFDKNDQQKVAILYVDEAVPTGFTINLFAMARKNGIDMVVATESK
ncbi:MAG: biopolymer transporter ExbD [Flavobacteriales bacterium]|nr:biopolymer transporter ExbD [Flavobacteriales bacterium]